MAGHPQGGARNASAQSAALRIVVIEGEGGVNIIQQKTAVAPVVEVRDRNDQPVAGVVVRFAIQGGRATFSGAQAVTVTTNAAGRAAVAALTPVSNGAFQISASAAFQGQTAAVTIAQTNVMTAASAASATAGAGAGGGGGGSFPTVLVASVGGAAVGGLIAVDQIIPDFRGCGGGGGGSPVMVVDVTEVLFDFNCEGGETVTWDFGDGTPESPDNVPHIYHSLGTFQIVGIARKGDKTVRAFPGSETSVTVSTLTGRWRTASTGAIFDLVQTGAQVSGTYPHPSGTGTGSVSGTLQHGRNPILQATLSGPPIGTLVGNTQFEPNTWNVVVSGSGFPPLPFTSFVRQ